MLIVNEFLNYDLGKLMLSQVGPQMSQILIAVAHEVSQDCVVDCVRLTALLHGVLVLEFDFGCVDFETFHAFLQLLVVIGLCCHTYY